MFTRVKLPADLRSPRNVNSADGFGGYHRGDGHRIGAKRGVTGGADGRLAGEAGVSDMCDFEANERGAFEVGRVSLVRGAG